MAKKETRQQRLDREIAESVAARGKHTVLVGNAMLGSSRYVGTFDDEASAQAYARVEADRTRKFASYEVWTGTPRSPGRAIGPVVQGTK